MAKFGWCLDNDHRGCRKTIQTTMGGLLACECYCHAQRARSLPVMDATGSHHSDEGEGLNKYKCPHCHKVVDRDSDKAWIKSYCESKGLSVRLQRVKETETK